MYLKLYYLYRGINKVYLYLNISEDIISQFANCLTQLKSEINYHLLVHPPCQDLIQNKVKDYKNVFIEFTDVDLSFTIDILNLKNNYFFKYFSFKEHIDLNLISLLYKQINIPSEKYSSSHNFPKIENHVNLYNELVDFTKLGKDLKSNELKNFCLFKNIKVSELNGINTNLMYKKNHSETINLFNSFLNKLHIYINKYEDVNYLDFLSYNIIGEFSNFKSLVIPIINYKTMKNVFYTKKGFYNNNGERIKNTFLKEDFEYKEFIDKNNYYIGRKLINNPNEKLDIKNIEKVEIKDENILYLDYIYGFYNFGEFWDVMHRISSLKPDKKYVLFHLPRNRVSNISYYFKKYNLSFPAHKQELKINLNKTYFFKNINFLIIKNIFRGFLDNFLSFNLNYSLNQSKFSNENYSLYLKRGGYGREIKNENQLIEKLKKICNNLMVIDGSEEFDIMLHYWTNAVFIIGAHGSLLKNMIYCKKNPIFIELTPDRHPCFYGNANQIRFLYFYINVNKDNKENILLDNSDIDNIINLTKCILPK